MNLPHYRRYMLHPLNSRHNPMRKCARFILLAIAAASLYLIVADSLSAHEESAKERMARLALESERMEMDKYLARLSDEDLRIIRSRWKH